jgi:putative transposase
MIAPFLIANMFVVLLLYVLAFCPAIAFGLLCLIRLVHRSLALNVWPWFAARQKFFRRKTPALCIPAKLFRSAAPRRSGGRRKPAWTVDMVVQLYTEGRKSYREVWKEFNRLYAVDGVTVCLGTVYAWIQRYCTEAEIIRAQTRNRVPDFAPANLRWCLDGTGKADTTGAQHFILGIVDHGTRLNLLLTRLEVANSLTILEHIFETVKQFGKPKIIRTDNASVFKSTVFQEGLISAGIRHEFTDPGKPWQNGRIERFFLTLKQKLNLILPLDATALDHLLAEFRFWYNTVRPHQHLHNFTPMEVWTGVNPFKVKPKKIFRFSGWDGMLKGFYMLR